MPRNITYSVPIGPTYDKFGIDEVAQSKALFIVDNAGSDFELVRIIKNEDLFIPKRIFSSKSIKDKTRVLSNTTNILATDVFFDGVPYFLKIIKRVSNSRRVLIDGVESTCMDTNFIYTNETSPLIQYLDSNNKVVMSDKPDVYPVFIWDGMMHLSSIISVDNKSFRYSKSDDKIQIEYSKPNVHSETDQNSIFEIHRDGNKFFVHPLLHEITRDVSGEKIRYLYDYSVITPNIRTVRHETGKVLSNNVIKLKNKRVMKNSIVLSVVDKRSGLSIYSMDNTGATIENNSISMESGEVNVYGLINLPDLNSGNYYYEVSYRYVDISSNEIEILIDRPDTIFKKVLLSICPTSITQKAGVTKFSPKISYTIANIDGSIVSTIDSTVPLYDFTIPVYKGFGQDGYSAHGYSGISEERTINFVAPIESAREGSGYSDGGFSEGPFSGSYINRLEDIVNLLTVQNNAIAGTIVLAEVEFYPRISDVKIYLTNKISKSKILNAPTGRLELFSGESLHLSATNEFSNIEQACGVMTTSAVCGIKIPGYIASKTNLATNLIFNTEEVSRHMNTDGTFNTTAVMVDPVSIIAASRYPTSSSHQISKDLFILFNKDLSEYTGTYSMKFSDDLKTLAVSVDLPSNNLIVGVGIKSGENSTYPTAWISA